MSDTIWDALIAQKEYEKQLEAENARLKQQLAEKDKQILAMRNCQNCGSTNGSWFTEDSCKNNLKDENCFETHSQWVQK